MVNKAKLVSVDNSFETLHTTCYNTSASPQWRAKRNCASKSWAVHLGMEDSRLRRTAMKVKRGSTWMHKYTTTLAVHTPQWQMRVDKGTFLSKQGIVYYTAQLEAKMRPRAPTKTCKCADESGKHNTASYYCNIYSNARISVLHTSSIHWRQPKQVFVDLQATHGFLQNGS